MSSSVILQKPPASREREDTGRQSNKPSLRCTGKWAISRWTALALLTGAYWFVTWYCPETLPALNLYSSLSQKRSRQIPTSTSWLSIIQPTRHDTTLRLIAGSPGRSTSRRYRSLDGWD